MGANVFLGEAEIDLAGRKVRLKRSFAAILEIEQELGAGLVPLALRVLNQNYGLREAMAIIRAGMKAAGEPALLQADLGEAILGAGLLKLSGPLTAFLSGALTGGDDGAEPGEAKAAGPTGSTTAA